MSSRQTAVASESAKPRQLIIGCDGTNNTLTGGCHDTNVLKMIGQLVPYDSQQVLYYDPGVGSPDQLPPLGLMNDVNRRKERIAGLVVGTGIYENIADAYLFLVDHFQPGDQIYIFGFSRGAFTARCVAGMVNMFGIIRAESKPLVLTMIRAYFSTPLDEGIHSAGWWARKMAERAGRRKQANERIANDLNVQSPDPARRDVLAYLGKKKLRRSTQAEVARQVRDQFTSPHGKTASVHFVGVWDTVSSVGIPLFRRSITSSGLIREKLGLRHIRQALSMDEHRLSFRPRLYWDEDYLIGDGDDPSRSRSLRQRWFRGVHSDVGGGYDLNEAGLSDEAYRWMLNEAIACGLRTTLKKDRSEHARKPYIAHDACRDTPWWGIAGLIVRSNRTYKDADTEHQIKVIPEGAARNDPPMVSVWDAGGKHLDWPLWLACVAVIVFWTTSGWLGYAAMHGDDGAGFLERIWKGGMDLNSWQQTYAWSGFASGAYPVPRSVAHAFGAILADCALIVAYSWLLGLCASWAFTRMAAHRQPQDKVSPIFLLGLAPMCAVLADGAENLLTMLTLWLISEGWWEASAWSGILMLLANALKWAGLLASLLLTGWGGIDVRRSGSDVHEEGLGVHG